MKKLHGKTGTRTALTVVLKANPVDKIAPWWHVDLDLCREQETMADMGLSRERGFLGYQQSATSFTDLFDRLRKERIIP